MLGEGDLGGGSGGAGVAMLADVALSLKASPALQAFAQKKFQVDATALQHIPLRILLDQLLLDYIAEESADAYKDLSIEDLRAGLAALDPRLDEKLKSDLRLLFFEYTANVKNRSHSGSKIFESSDEKVLRKIFLLIKLVFYSDDQIDLIKIREDPFSTPSEFDLLLPDRYLNSMHAPHYTKSFAGHVTNGIANLVHPGKKRAMLRADGILSGNIHSSNYGTPGFVVVRASLLTGRPEIEILHRSGPGDSAMVVIANTAKSGISCPADQKAFLTKPQSIGLRTHKVKPELFHRQEYREKTDRNSVGFLFEQKDVTPVSFRKYREATYASPYKFFDLEEAKRYCDDGAQKFLFASYDEFVTAITEEADPKGGTPPLNEVIARIHAFTARSAIIAYYQESNAILRAIAVKELVLEKLKKRLTVEGGGSLPSWFQHFDIPILVEDGERTYHYLSREVQQQSKKAVAAYPPRAINGCLRAREFGFLSFIEPTKLLDLKMPAVHPASEGQLVILNLLQTGYLGLASELIKKAGSTLDAYIAIHKAEPDLARALSCACHQDNYKMVQVLLKYDVPIDDTCIKAALRKGQLTILEALVNKVRANSAEASIPVTEFLAVETMRIKIHYAGQPKDPKLKSLLGILDPGFMLRATPKPEAAVGVGEREGEEGMGEEEADDDLVSDNAVFGARPADIQKGPFEKFMKAASKIVLYEMTHRTIFDAKTREACECFLKLCASSGRGRGELMLAQCAPLDGVDALEGKRDGFGVRAAPASAVVAPAPVVIAPVGASSAGGGSGAGSSPALAVPVATAALPAVVPASVVAAPPAVSPAGASSGGGGSGAVVVLSWEQKFSEALKELEALDPSFPDLLKQAKDAWNTANEPSKARSTVKKIEGVQKTLIHGTESLTLYKAVGEIAQSKGSDFLKAFIAEEIVAVEQLIADFEKSLTSLQSPGPFSAAALGPVKGKKRGRSPEAPLPPNKPGGPAPSAGGC